MELSDALRRRRMVRDFSGAPVDPEVAAAIFAEALRSPTAGNARGVSFVVLVGDDVARYFAAATDESWRAEAPRAEGLQRAGAVGVCVADPAAYVDRYGAPDKAGSGLGTSLDAWPVPYWVGDAGAATMTALLLAEDAGLAACFLGASRRTDELLSALRAPQGLLVYGAILLGHQGPGDRRSASLDRPGPTRAERVHVGRWGQHPPRSS